MIKITNKAEVLANLYNASKSQEMGFLHFTPEPMTIEEAEELLKEHKYFDHLKGRVMKVDLSGDEFDPRLYDRDNGEGAAEKALSSPVKMDKEKILSSIRKTKGKLNTITTIKGNTITLGLEDAAELLNTKMDKIIKDDCQ